MKASGRTPKIYLVEKGPDVPASKELATELGIADKLIWLKEMSMREIFDWYARADIVFDQLGEHVMGAVTLDAMLTGRPVVTNARPEIFDPIIPEASPICHARTPEDVHQWLQLLVDDPELRRNIGVRSREFVRRHFSASQTAEAIAAHFEGLHPGQRPG
jgi:glycosyltransferase involved in cell wall biosynthesis